MRSYLSLSVASVCGVAKSVRPAGLRMAHLLKQWNTPVHFNKYHMLMDELLCEDAPPGVLRDVHGVPQRFYHGTAETFSTFDPKRIHDKEGSKLKLGFGPGVLYFTDHPDDAFRYATRHGIEGVNIHPVFLIMHKPLVMKYWDDPNTGWLRAAARGHGSYAGIKSYVARMRRFIRDVRAEGYDGIIVSDGTPSPPGEYVVFEPAQVISYLAPDGMEIRGQR
jgi:hypothetical protein